MTRFRLREFVIGFALAAACILLGAAIPSTNQALGEVRGTPEQPQFQAGSVPILRDISSTLRQIDGRLARMETSVQKLQQAASLRARNSAAAQDNN